MLEFKLKPTEYKVYKWIENELKKGPLFSTTDEIAFNLNLSPRGVRENLIIMEQVGVIERIKTNTKPTEYIINEETKWILH